jgi:hypothetical protein
MDQLTLRLAVVWIFRRWANWLSDTQKLLHLWHLRLRSSSLGEGFDRHPSTA